MPSGSLHVLVVDDDRLVRMALRHYLQLEGWVLSEAESGEAAMQLLRASDQPVHLLVTDVVLRGQKGMQLAAAARALQPQLAVVFVSAYSADVLTERGLFEPSLPLLHKPFTREELRQAISDALAMQEWEHAD